MAGGELGEAIDAEEAAGFLLGEQHQQRAVDDRLTEHVPVLGVGPGHAEALGEPVGGVDVVLVALAGGVFGQVAGVGDHRLAGALVEKLLLALAEDLGGAQQALGGQRVEPAQAVGAGLGEGQQGLVAQEPGGHVELAAGFGLEGQADQGDEAGARRFEGRAQVGGAEVGGQLHDALGALPVERFEARSVDEALGAGVAQHPLEVGAAVDGGDGGHGVAGLRWRIRRRLRRGGARPARRRRRRGPRRPRRRGAGGPGSR